MQLRSNATNAVTYEWSGPNNFTANVPNPSINEITPLNNGQYGVTVTNSSGCQAVSFVAIDTIETADELPTITNNGPICEGEDLILSSSTTGTNFDWIGPLGGSQSTLQNNTLLSTNGGMTTIPVGDAAYLSGTWSVRVSDSTGCISESNPIEIIINQIPIPEKIIKEVLTDLNWK